MAATDDTAHRSKEAVVQKIATNSRSQQNSLMSFSGLMVAEGPIESSVHGFRSLERGKAALPPLSLIRHREEFELAAELVHPGKAERTVGSVLVLRTLFSSVWVECEFGLARRSVRKESAHEGKAEADLTQALPLYHCAYHLSCQQKF
jgi:hypothetical protein